MQRIMCTAKIHNAHVTDANLQYIGSITIDEDLLDEVGIFPYERVQVANITNGNRLETYAMAGKRGSGIVCMNGAAAHKAKIGDQIIVIAYGLCDEKEARGVKPRIVFLDKNNRIDKTQN